MGADREGIGAAFAELAALPSDVAGLRATVSELITEVRAMRRQLPPAMGSKADAARVLRCSLSHVDRLIASGQIRATKIGRSVRVDLASLAPPSEEAVAQLAHRARGV